MKRLDVWIPRFTKSERLPKYENNSQKSLGVGTARRVQKNRDQNNDGKRDSGDAFRWCIGEYRLEPNQIKRYFFTLEYG